MILELVDWYFICGPPSTSEEQSLALGFALRFQATLVSLSSIRLHLRCPDPHVETVASPSVDKRPPLLLWLTGMTLYRLQGRLVCVCSALDSWCFIDWFGDVDAFQKIIFAFFGLYIWEMFMTIDFEWSLLTRRRVFHWPLVSSNVLWADIWQSKPFSH